MHKHWWVCDPHNRYLSTVYGTTNMDLYIRIDSQHSTCCNNLHVRILYDLLAYFCASEPLTRGRVLNIKSIVISWLECLEKARMCLLFIMLVYYESNNSELIYTSTWYKRLWPHSFLINLAAYHWRQAAPSSTSASHFFKLTSTAYMKAPLSKFDARIFFGASRSTNWDTRRLKVSEKGLDSTRSKWSSLFKATYSSYLRLKTIICVALQDWVNEYNAGDALVNVIDA